MKKIVQAVGCFLLCSVLHAQVSLIVFSFDRAMQLYALLESIDTYCTHIDEIAVIYRVSSGAHRRAYQQVMEHFGHLPLHAIRQRNAKEFQSLTLDTLKQCKSKYVVFAVDDIIITDDIDFSDCISAIERADCAGKQVWGFYLRLGKNIMKDYFSKKEWSPALTPFHTMYVWSMHGAQGDWGYPNSLDAVVYKKDAVLQQIQRLTFTSPNTLKGEWAHRFSENKRKQGMCYACSKLVNVPANQVQQDWVLPNMHSYSAQDLLRLFNKGLKIDIRPFYRLRHDTPHSDQPYTFIDR